MLRFHALMSSLAWLLGLLFLAGGARAELVGCRPTSLTGPVEQGEVCYGPAAWREPTLGGKVLLQSFDFYPAVRARPQGAPLIVWAHPNGSTKALPESSALFKALVAPALASGFAFASVEYRHPVVNAPASAHRTVPHRDLALAVQFMRANAGALGVDPANVFFVGQSRGSLALWTALQDDMADPDSPDVVARQSTRVNAVFAVNAQTTYDGSEFAELFIVPRDRPTFVHEFNRRHPHHAEFGSAIRSVVTGRQSTPPVMLRYDGMPVPRLLTLEDLAVVDALHYPNFGPALCTAYALADRHAHRCRIEFDPAYTGDPMAAFGGYVDFFRRHLAP